MLSPTDFYKKRIGSLLFFLLALSVYSGAKDYSVTGRVTDNNGAIVPNARISMMAGTIEYNAVSKSDGSYYLKISGIYSDIQGVIETGMPFPNPFVNSVSIPFIINSSGDLSFAVYSLSGQKIREITFPAVSAGSYRLTWDGCNQNGSPQKTGLYIYAITFKGVTRSGRLIKSSGSTGNASGTYLEPVMIPSDPQAPTVPARIHVITSVTCTNYYPLRLTDISISQDTIIDFVLTLKELLPYKTSGNYIAMKTGPEYRPLNLKGINLGSSPPGTFPGEIAYAVTPAMYEQWINRMAEAGFNAIRIYTLHPPWFYEKLAEYNYRHPDKPLLLFQGIWLEEVEENPELSNFDLFNRTTSFGKEIHEVIDCINGKGDIAFRLGKAYGKYATDVSRWTAGYILGREISPEEVMVTDESHPTSTSFTGSQFSISGASATEVFVTRFLDETVYYESQHYSVRRPVSITSWPTLDPLIHPTEVYTQEDVATFDITKIKGRNQQAGLFASYHAYPYYPNFISEEPAYQAYKDKYGPDSYLGYLNALKSYYNDIPLVIAEFGVPSSWGSAHQSSSNMNHGGYSEQEQGEKNVRIIENIRDSGCAGGFMFSWFDEWFKPTWIVLYLEAFGTMSGGVFIPTRQLWHNLASPEQNFGLISFDQTSSESFTPYLIDKPSGPIKKIESTWDNSYFYANIESSYSLTEGDTVMVAFDTYSKDTGESQLPNGKKLVNRSEFLLTMVLGKDTAFHHVTQAYDMNGLTPRFNKTDPSVQMYRSTITNGAPWKLMKWINDEYELTVDTLGRFPMEKSDKFSAGGRAAVAWSANGIKIRIPWTLLYYFDPTQMKVIDGAVSNDGGYNFEILTRQSEGVALSVYNKGVVTSTQDRHIWPKWLVVPGTTPREKRSLKVIETFFESGSYFLQ